MNYLLLTVYVLVYIGGVCSQTGTDAKNLRTQLFVTDAYDKKIIPSLDQSYIKGNVLHGTFRFSLVFRIEHIAAHYYRLLDSVHAFISMQ